MSRITRAALGPAAAAAGLDAPAPGGRFRRSMVLSIPTGGEAQAASVASGALLGLAFTAREVDARSAGAPEPAALSSGGAGLVLSLPAARRLVRVRLQSVQAHDQVAAFRFDGNAVADDPVAVGEHGVGGASLEVTDLRLILRRRRNGSEQALGAGEVAAAVLRYVPVNPRIGFTLADDGEGETFLPPATDASGQPVFPAIADRGAAFARALSDRLARRAGAAPLPDRLVVTLILEADEPCAAAVASLDLTLLLERRGFLGGPEKRVLRFPGGRREVQRIAIGLPSGNPLVLSASLALRVSAGSAGGAAASAAPPAASSEGVSLAPGTPIAVRVDPSEATVVLGAEAVLGTPEDTAEVMASLWDERDGLPNARLAEAAPVRVLAARNVLVPFAFPKGIALPPGPAWLVLTATRGRAVLLLGPPSPDGTVAVGGAGGFRRVAAAAGRAACARLRVAAAAAGAEDKGPYGIDLSLGGTPVPLQAGGDDGRDLEADLTTALAARPGQAGGEVEIEVASTRRSLVTIDRAMLRYVLG